MTIAWEGRSVRPLERLMTEARSTSSKAGLGRELELLEDRRDVVAAGMTCEERIEAGPGPTFSIGQHD